MLAKFSWTDLQAYNFDDPWYGSGVPNEAAKFAPMSWCLNDLNKTMPSYVNTSYFMGFNEPNNIHNCNTDAKTVAKAWAQVMATWPKSKLVSPATAGDGTAFFDEFFAECKTLYGAEGCRISHLAVHYYSCTASETMTYLKTMASRYGYPVWLTEFSCGDGAEGKPTKDHLAFMKDIVPQLDAADFVYRYAWMSAHDGKGLRGLVETGANGKEQLTELGTTYNTL